MKTRWLLALLALLLVLVSLAGLAFGTASIPLRETLSILLHGGTSDHSSSHIILLKIRLPRVILGIFAGCGLAVSGSVMQGIFRNPLADPYLLGVAGGATSGAALCIMLGWSSLFFVVPLGAFLGGLLAVFLVYQIAAQASFGHLYNNTLILVGVAVGAMFSAITSMITYFSGRDRLQQIIFWMMGHLGAATWSQIWPVLGLVLLCVGLLLLFAKELNALALGDEMALHLGIQPQRIKRGLLGLTTLLTAVIVAITGTIGFVGLIIPHAMRLLCGPDHRHLLPVSALAGAVFLVLCDLVARILVPQQELPVGLITALCGAPFFLYLLRNQPSNP